MIHTSPLEGLLFYIGPFPVTGSLLISWGIILLLSVLTLLSRPQMEKAPGKWQTGLEEIYSAMKTAVEEIVGDHSDLVLPFIGTLWIFILFANLIGLIPGLSAPTADLSVTAALAFLVFCSVHWFGIRIEGWRSYFKHYMNPSPFLIPLHIISEISRTLALAVRLFGNVMSLEIAALLVLMVAGPLVPIPLLMLHIVEGVIQAYLFGVLALIYIAGALQSQEQRREKERLSQ